MRLADRGNLTIDDYVNFVEISVIVPMLVLVGARIRVDMVVECAVTSGWMHVEDPGAGCQIHFLDIINICPRLPQFSSLERGG